MFFMMGIMPGRKELNYNQLMICAACGKYGRYNVYMTYSVLSLFFIPVFKWGRQYFVQTSCCGATYRLNPDIGRRIEHGEQVEIRPADLERVQSPYGSRSAGNSGYNGYSYRNPGYDAGMRKICSGCGYSTEEDFEYCPKCGRRF